VRQLGIESSTDNAHVRCGSLCFAADDRATSGFHIFLPPRSEPIHVAPDVTMKDFSMKYSHTSRASQDRETAQQKADGQFRVWENRTQLVKVRFAAASAANDAKTVRLKALRLERERQESAAAVLLPVPAAGKTRGDPSCMSHETS